MNENSLSRWVIVVVIVFVLGAIVYGLIPSQGGGINSQPGLCVLNVTC
jgi:hypothetical protein